MGKVAGLLGSHQGSPRLMVIHLESAWLGVSSNERQLLGFRRRVGAGGISPGLESFQVNTVTGRKVEEIKACEGIMMMFWKVCARLREWGHV